MLISKEAMANLLLVAFNLFLLTALTVCSSCSKSLKYFFSVAECSDLTNDTVIAILKGLENGKTTNILKKFANAQLDHEVIIENNTTFIWSPPVEKDKHNRRCCWSVTNVTVSQGSNEAILNIYPLGYKFDEEHGKYWICNRKSSNSPDNPSGLTASNIDLTDNNCSLKITSNTESLTSSLSSFFISTLDTLILSSFTTARSSEFHISSYSLAHTTTAHTTTSQQSIEVTHQPNTSPTPSATVISHCPGDGSIWFDTPVRHNATGTCYRGTVNATRYCKENGVWDNVICRTSPAFDAIILLPQTNVSLTDTLKLLISEHLPLSQLLFFFNTIVTNKLSSQNRSQESLKFALEFTNYIIYSSKVQTENEELRNSIATHLLLTLDTLALNSLETNLSLSTDNIVLRIQEVVFPLGNNNIVGINVENNSIQLPSDISFTMNDTIKIASFVFRNLSQLLSPQTNQQQIVSPVVSATCIDCKKTDLNPQVNITFNLSSQEISPNDYLICVFLDIFESNSSLLTSSWSTEGCQQSSYLENSIITCQCDHLTHFAILLSPRVSRNGGIHDDILPVVGYVLTPISLVCMLLVIFTYTCMKSLWNLRSYIHIMLCINLFISQLLFVVGIERTEYLPVCSVIAVILQYMYLVTFMWMLMEGVVLYVALVRVFIIHPKRYIAAFTISSYGIPALYMMFIIPVGFLADIDHPYYLYYNNDDVKIDLAHNAGSNSNVSACWLDYQSGFVFTFIVPVLVIILANSVFFIMAIVVLCKNKKEKKLKKRQPLAIKIKNWLMISISLLIVMGIGWIFNILFFSREMLFIAYISTAFIASQGIIIFIMYVPCSENVRKAYIDWYQKINRKSSTVISGAST